jgi:YVTN family beta-propeller protein
VKVGRRPYAVALASGKAFVTDQYAGTVTVVDTADWRVVATIPVGEHPEGIEADAAGRYVYVACWFENTLERIDTARLAVTDKVAVGDGPRAFGAFLRAAR